MANVYKSEFVKEQWFDFFTAYGLICFAVEHP